MKKRKPVMISEELHTRLKKYCNSQGLVMERYVEAVIDTELYHDELLINPEYQRLQKELKNTLPKMRADENYEHSEEYKNILNELEQFHKNFEQ